MPPQKKKIVLWINVSDKITELSTEEYQKNSVIRNKKVENDDIAVFCYGVGFVEFCYNCSDVVFLLTDDEKDPIEKIVLQESPNTQNLLKLSTYVDDYKGQDKEINIEQQERKVYVDVNKIKGKSKPLFRFIIEFDKDDENPNFGNIYHQIQKLFKEVQLVCENYGIERSSVEWDILAKKIGADIISQTVIEELKDYLFQKFCVDFCDLTQEQKKQNDFFAELVYWVDVIISKDKNHYKRKNKEENIIQIENAQEMIDFSGKKEWKKETQVEEIQTKKKYKELLRHYYLGKLYEMCGYAVDSNICKNNGERSRLIRDKKLQILKHCVNELFFVPLSVRVINNIFYQTMLQVTDPFPKKLNKKEATGGQLIEFEQNKQILREYSHDCHNCISMNCAKICFGGCICCLTLVICSFIARLVVQSIDPYYFLSGGKSIWDDILVYAFAGFVICGFMAMIFFASHEDDRRSIKYNLVENIKNEFGVIENKEQQDVSNSNKNNVVDRSGIKTGSIISCEAKESLLTRKTKSEETGRSVHGFFKVFSPENYGYDNVCEKDRHSEFINEIK